MLTASFCLELISDCARLGIGAESNVNPSCLLSTFKHVTIRVGKGILDDTPHDKLAVRQATRTIFKATLRLESSRQKLLIAHD